MPVGPRAAQRGRGGEWWSSLILGRVSFRPRSPPDIEASASIQSPACRSVVIQASIGSHPYRPAPALRRRPSRSCGHFSEACPVLLPYNIFQPLPLTVACGRWLRLAPGWSRIGNFLFLIPGSHLWGELAPQRLRGRTVSIAGSSIQPVAGRELAESGRSGGCWNYPPPGPARPAFLPIQALCSVVGSCPSGLVPSVLVRPPPKSLFFLFEPSPLGKVSASSHAGR